MHRHAIGHRRSPGGVGAGDEIASELHRRQLAGTVAGKPRLDPRRMALRRRLHGFGTRIGPAYRTVGFPGRQCDQRLHREIELTAETAAAGRRDDANARGIHAQDERDLVAIHVRGLCAGENLDALADPPGIACLRLEIGMLDERRLESAARRRPSLSEAGCRVALLEETAGEHIVGAEPVQHRRARCQGSLDRQNRLARMPLDRQILLRDGLDRRLVADQRHHRFAAIVHAAFGQHGLVLDIGIDAIGVVRHVGRRQHEGETGMPALQFVERTESKGGARMGRTHRTKPEAVSRIRIRAEFLGPGQFGGTIELGDTGADRRPA